MGSCEEIADEETGQISRRLYEKNVLPLMLETENLVEFQSKSGRMGDL